MERDGHARLQFLALVASHWKVPRVFSSLHSRALPALCRVVISCFYMHVHGCLHSYMEL